MAAISAWAWAVAEVLGAVGLSPVLDKWCVYFHLTVTEHGRLEGTVRANEAEKVLPKISGDKCLPSAF